MLSIVVLRFSAPRFDHWLLTTMGKREHHHQWLVHLMVKQGRRRHRLALLELNTLTCKRLSADDALILDTWLPNLALFTWADNLLFTWANNHPLLNTATTLVFARLLPSGVRRLVIWVVIMLDLQMLAMESVLVTLNLLVSLGPRMVDTAALLITNNVPVERCIQTLSVTNRTCRNGVIL